MTHHSFRHWPQWLVLSLALMWVPVASPADVIRLSNGEWTPYLSERLADDGFVSHLVSLAFAAEGVTVEYVFRPWKRAYEEARVGRVDGSVVWSRTPEREADFLFTDPVIVGESVLFYRKASPIDWQTFDDLAKYRIGGTLGYQYAIERGQGVVIARVAEDYLNFAKLIKGRIDVFPSDRVVGYELLRKQFTSEDRVVITHHPTPYEATEYSVMISKKSPNAQAWVEKFNRGLATIRVTGQYEQVLEDQLQGRYELSPPTAPAPLP